MKNKDIYRELGEVDDRFIAESDPLAARKSKKRRKFTVVAACVSIFAVFMSLWLFLPFSSEYKDLSRYSDSEYYELMLKVQTLTCYPQNYKFKNNFEKYILSNIFWTEEQSAEGELTAGSIMPSLPADKYEEVTDNQFEGIIEGDLFKRSDKAIFYLDPNTLTLYSYSIEGEESVMLDSFAVAEEFGIPISKVHCRNSVIYLAPDCGSVTVILPQYQKTAAVSIDVSDPAEMKAGATLEVSGGYISSRMIEGKLLMITGWGLGRDPDFSKESEYLPQITWEGKTQSLAAEDIVYSEDSGKPFYTVMALLDMNSLETVDSAAVLDYAGTVTVSENNIFLSCFFIERSEKPGEAEGEVLGETIYRNTVYVVSHSGGELENMGNVALDGTVTDQYAMDEYEGQLRVVTETRKTDWRHIDYPDGGSAGHTLGISQSASLYCIDLETFEIIGSVVAFAPEDEEVNSVRFDGDYGYVCTAETKYYKDPVYFFDLSDPANITYSDTGVIDGYSTSLVDMGGGRLLGIGYGDSNFVLKVEVYEERGDKVESLCSFERKFVSFSEDYKSYYINRAEGFVGLMVSNEYVSEYILLRFDGEEITQVALKMMKKVENAAWTRAAVIDSVLYIFAEDDFRTVKIDQ